MQIVFFCGDEIIKLLRPKDRLPIICSNNCYETILEELKLRKSIYQRIKNFISTTSAMVVKLVSR